MTKYKDILVMLENRHPNSNIYVISDQHFYHKNMAKYRGCFTSVEEMNNYIITKHNETIKKDDVVIFLGDYSFKKSKIKKLNEKLNGNKYLVIGNHDDINLIKDYEKTGFLGIFISDVKIDNMILSHYPKNDEFEDLEDKIVHKQVLLKEFNKEKYINYHGHVHEYNYQDNRYINVSVENINYKPVLIKKTSEKKQQNFINSEEFINTVEDISKNKSISKEFLLKDYFYTYMLTTIEKYNQNFFLYGSFGLYKKYFLQSNFSDIDIGIIYDNTKSKGSNQKTLKKICDTSYEKMNEINNVSNFFYKRSGDICIYESNYYNKNKTYVETVFDANLVGINFFKETDFQIIQITSDLERFTPTNNEQSKIKHPSCSIKTTTKEGDLANLLLQYVFGKNNDTKRLLILKKIKCLYYSKKIKEINIEIYEDVMYRFLLRNIAFLEKFNRIDEIKYIKECFKNLDEIIKGLSKYEFMNTKIFNKESKIEIIREELSKDKQITDSIKTLLKY